MDKIVLDTNIVVSALITAHGNASRIIGFVFSGEEQRLIYSSQIIDEYREVISRPKFNLSAGTQELMLDSLMHAGKLVIPVKSDIFFFDETDRKFYDAAETSDAILITGNRKHYPEKDFILTPSDFVEKYIFSRRSDFDT
jgi:putative PIN family toxin of toxin-antitoxin system